MNKFINELFAYDADIHAIDIADALWLNSILGDGECVIDVTEKGKKVEDQNEPPKEKSEASDTLPKEVTHTIRISRYPEQRADLELSLDSSPDSSISYGVEFDASTRLPKIERQFSLLRSKQKSQTKKLDETLTAEYIANVGFFHPIFQEPMRREGDYVLNIIIDQSHAIFLWQAQMEHFLKSIRSSNIFKSVEVFALDSSKAEASLSYYRSHKGISPRSPLFHQEKRLTLLFSDIVGLAWKSGHMFEMMESWTRSSFVAIVSMLPRQMWQKTPLRKGVKLFMHSLRRFPKNSDLVAEFAFLERKLKEYSMRIPVIDFSKNSFADLSEVLTARKDSWVDTRTFKPESTQKDLVERPRPSLSGAKRVEEFFASALPHSRLLAIYCSVLPLNQAIIKKVIEIKELGEEEDAFAELYFGGLIYKDSDNDLGEYTFYPDVRQELIEHITIDEAKQLYKRLDSVISSSLNSRFGMLELLYEHKKGDGELKPKEIELVRLLIEILAQKGQYYQRDIDRISPLVETIYPSSNTFQMGSTEYSDEQPIHTVTFDYSFEIGKYPVTFEEFDYFCEMTGRKKPDDRGWGRGERPVIDVSWEDAREYCTWLNKQLGIEPDSEYAYRLPSEAEWEYAARAGTTTKWSFGDDEKALDKYAWYGKNSDGKTHPVGEKKSNPWGLYDMHGNVWEWCEDDWAEDYQKTPIDGSPYRSGKKDDRKIFRGGSWINGASITRSSVRYWDDSDNRDDYIGFRLLRTLPS